MTEKQLLALCAVQACTLVAVVGLGLTPLALAPCVAAAALLAALSKKAEAGDEEVLLFVRELLRRRKEGLGRALSGAASRGYSFSAGIRRMLARQRLGAEPSGPRGSAGDRSLAELERMAAAALASGASLVNGLERFERRLDGEVRKRNRARSKVGGMQYITYLGAAFFLPLFGGISSTILTASTSMLGLGAPAIAHGFLVAIGAYILAVLAIDSFFTKPHCTPLERVSSILTPFSISAMVLLASAAYMGYVL